MMWVDLHRGILEEFALLARGYRFDFSHHLRTTAPLDAQAHAWKLDCKSRRLRRARIAVAAKRPPCPHCGGKVERLGTIGVVPTYCRPECKQAAARKRWRAKQRELKIS